MPPNHTSEFDRQLRELEVELKKLEVEYNLFFAGRLPKLPWETRARVEALIKRYDRLQIQNTAERFRFQGLQSRFSAFCELWERNLRTREGTRPGARRPGGDAPPQPPPSRRHDDEPVEIGAVPAATGPVVTSLRDPSAEADKVRALYEQLREARRQAGEADVPFDRFQDVVRAQVSKLGRDGGEVVFKVTTKDGRVAFTAKPAGGSSDES
ncbi:MAG: MXAN_5187 C-terminal domain-containing protein [Vicinamibacterales bacterium]